MLGARVPAVPVISAAMVVGLFEYSISLVLFVLTLRDLGSTRTSAYFSTAPFMAAAIAILAVGDHASPTFWMAAVLWARAYGST